MRQLTPTRFIAALRADATARRELPADIAHDTRRRVRVAAAIGALSYAVFLGFQLSRVVESAALERSINLNHDALGVLLCMGLLLVSGRASWSDQFVLAAALVVEVLLSMVISLHLPWAAFVRTGYLPSLTWVALVIILFPLLVPIPPTTTLVVSILCALTVPAGLWVLSAQAAIQVKAGDFWASSVTGAVAVGIAFVASNTVYRANRQIAAARVIGSYELIKLLGQGGMGEVWSARHSLLARPAAVKLILPEAVSGSREKRDAVVARFTREAQMTANLRSPHTIELFDFGVSADGAFYYAMELLEGMNAEHFVYRFGPLDPRRVVYWLAQACHSLREAHAMGFVHRDIKPANLYVCRHGLDVDFVKVLDFGLVKPVALADAADLTSPGTRMGTPGYMAPEQIRGLPVTESADLYALGCVGYWLLAGKGPFEAETAGELMRQHLQSVPPPLPVSSAGPVPRGLEDLIMACLAKDPEQRPPDVDRLCCDLDRCLEGNRWTQAEAEEWWKKNRVEN